MTAIEAMRAELRRIQREQANMVTEYGIVEGWARYRYSELCRTAREYRESIEYMCELYNNKKGVER